MVSPSRMLYIYYPWKLPDIANWGYNFFIGDTKQISTSFEKNTRLQYKLVRVLLFRRFPDLDLNHYSFQVLMRLFEPENEENKAEAELGQAQPKLGMNCN